MPIIENKAISFGYEKEDLLFLFKTLLDKGKINEREYTKAITKVSAIKISQERPIVSSYVT